MLSRKLQTLITLSAAGVAALLLGASTAHAEDEFKHAFEHQLGRIAAHQVAHLGKAALFGAYYDGPTWRARFHRRPLRHMDRRFHRRLHRHHAMPHHGRGHVHGRDCGFQRRARVVVDRTVVHSHDGSRRRHETVTTRRILRRR
jgi:hypothetical protein